jgi:glycosyltransferase involved in cell wall biosynthesis
LSCSGGVETYLLSLIPRLDALGHQQFVAFAEGDEDLVSNSLKLPLLASADRASRRAGYRRMVRLLADTAPDVVHVHNVQNSGMLDACLDNAPTILHGHDYRQLCPASTFYRRGTETICERTCGPGCFLATVRGRCLSWRPSYAWNYYRRVRSFATNAQRFAQIVAPSAYASERFIRGGVLPERISVLPYFSPIEPLDWNRPLPIRPTILFIGRIRPLKGWRFFIDALSQLPQDVRGLMIGDFTPSSSSAVLRSANRLGCADRLELRPWVSRGDVANVYREATVLVVPSIWPETLGIVGLEALACGVPVVGCDVGGMGEWLIDGRTGRLVPPKDAAAIAATVAEILARPDRGEALGEAGRALIRAKFSSEWHVDELVAQYRSVSGAGLVLR